MPPRARLSLPSALSVVALVQGCASPSPGTDAAVPMMDAVTPGTDAPFACPPPDASVTPEGTSLHGYPVVRWNGVDIELLPDGGCEPPPTI